MNYRLAIIFENTRLIHPGKLDSGIGTAAELDNSLSRVMLRCSAKILAIAGASARSLPSHSSADNGLMQDGTKAGKQWGYPLLPTRPGLVIGSISVQKVGSGLPK
jgi:hypothetical protein